MATHLSHIPLLLLITLICALLITKNGASEVDNRKVYIVYMGHNPNDDISTSALHMNMLQDAIGSDDASKYLLHRYTTSFHGFSAKLTDEEARKLAGMDGVVSVFPSRSNKVATTRSWDFLGFPLGVKRSSTESDIIIGVLDTGIWPESPSFSDVGYGPPPKRWKGICQSSSNFTCNNKIIGARHFKLDGKYDPKDLKSPRDADGHGTHTASTAAGNIVRGASLEGLRLGIARGGVPRARIAVYKVCWLAEDCMDHDILAGFEAAIADGVDIISISVGGNYASNLFSDSLAIGSFHAMKNGILTSQSAGNEGPNQQTTGSVSPWILSVAAGTIDPKLITPVKLGNNMVFDGVSFNSFKLDEMYPLIYAGDAPNLKAGFNGSISRFCIKDSLDKDLVKGKITLCDSPSTGEPELLAGAVGSVMGYSGPYFEFVGPFPLPASVVDSNQAANIFHYIKSTRNATAVIKESVEIKDVSAPYVASFSSRGPNPIVKHILKPDLTAPGVHILAAFPPNIPIAPGRLTPFNMMSGTSMACPHVSGIAAYIKTFHPQWSPAAIKSALMTTASPMSAEINTDAEFAYGAGHLNPMKAVDPGLVYDANEVDYVRFLCGEGYTNNQIKSITGNFNSSCSKFGKEPTDLNYPSIVVPTLRNEGTIVIFHRTVTNVGPANSTYKAVVNIPSSAQLEIQVKPNVLRFQYTGQKLPFTVNMTAIIQKEDDPIVSASLIWHDGVHQVRSPIVVYVPY